MYNQNDILTALQNGQEPQDIANKFADALNAAIKAKAEADKKAAEAANRNQEKIEWVESLLSDLLDFLQEFYPEIYDVGLRDHIPAAELVKAMDQARDEVVKMQPTLNELNDLIAKMEIERDKRSKINPVDDPISAFLKSNGLKM